ncbi:hypothetical protein GCM10027043_16770 [Ferruginibacter profundus]
MAIAVLVFTAILLFSPDVVKAQNVSGFGYTSYTSVNAGNWTYGAVSNPFTVTYSGNTWNTKVIATYAPVATPAALSNYTQPGTMLELGALSVTTPPSALFTFTSVLPTGAVMFLQDIDALESFRIEFLDASGALLNPAAIGTYNLSNPARSAVTFNATNITVTAVDNNNYAESLSDFVLSSGLVKQLRITQIASTGSVASAGTAEFYFAAPPLTSVNGNVFNDPNGGNVDNSTGSANLVPAGMFANLVNSSGIVVATVTVNTDGTFAFVNVAAGTYTVVAGTTQGTVGSAAPAESWPSGWVNTGDFNGVPNTGNTNTTPNVSSSFTATTSSLVTNINFGIEQPPLPVGGTATAVPNPGGTTQSANEAGLFGGTDPSGGSITSLNITAFPSNATSISINGVLYTTLAAIQAAYPSGIPTNASGVPTVPVTVDPIDGVTTVIILFNVTDNAGVTSASVSSVNIPFGSALPVTLISFTANPKENDVVLNWVVAIEINVVAYEIEYSTNGIDYTRVSTIPATGSGNYIFLHTSPNQGLKYYRLRIIDNNGSKSYSQSIKVNAVLTAGEIKVYPVPAKTSINITVPKAMINQSAAIMLFNMDGKMIYRKITSALNQTEVIDVSKLPAGNYIIQVVAANELFNAQLQVIK